MRGTVFNERPRALQEAMLDTNSLFGDEYHRAADGDLERNNGKHE
jgi:hypothetical protein